MMKKILLTTILSLLIPFAVLAQEAYAVYTTDGTLTFYYDKQKSSRSGTKYALNTGTNAPGWYTDHRKDIKKVVFNSSFANARPTSTWCWFSVKASEKSVLTNIVGIQYLNTSEVTQMGSMFAYCNNLKELDVSRFNTSKVTYMGLMFCDCSSLTTLDVSKFDTRNVTGMGAMFDGCSSLTSIDVSHFNTSNVTNFWCMFMDCSSLKSINVTNFNTSKVTDFAAMFDDCSSLTSIDVSHFNTSNATRLNSMFSGCSSLTSLDLSSFNTSKVTGMAFMFSDCKSLKTLNISKFNSASVTTMSGIFRNCSGLTSLDLSHLDTRNVTEMSWMLNGCTGLKSLDLSTFNTSKVTEMDYMFDGCTSLTTICVGNNWSTNKVSESKDMFRNCIKLVGGAGTKYNSNHVDVAYAHIDGGTSNPGYLTDKNATIQADEAYAVYTTDGTLTFYYDKQKSSRSGTKYELNSGENAPGWYTDHCEDIKKVVFTPSFSNARPTSTCRWFSGTLMIGTQYHYKSLSEIEGIEYLNTSNVTNMENMFFCCARLTGLDVSHFNTSNVTNMKSMFSHCRSLTNLDVSNFDTRNVTDMRDMFYFCQSLTSLDVSNFDTRNVTDMRDMFNNCQSLTSLDVSNFDTRNVTDTYRIFFNCKSLTSLDVSNFDTRNVTNMGLMFYFCQSLTSLDVSNFDTRNVTDMRDMFYNCQSLTSLDVSNFDTRNVINMSYMFYGCESLTTIYVGNGWNTDKVIYSDNMFSGCSNLVGGAGTKYDANHRDVAYAHIDGGASNPGYLTDKNKKEKVCDADDLGRFLRNLSGSQNEVDIPLCDEATIDEDVEVDDDLKVFIDGLGKNPPQQLLFAHSTICIRNVNSNWTFRSITFANKDDATGGGIKNVGALTFRGCTFMSGDYVIENLSGGRLVFSEGTVVEGQGNIINSGSVYVDGTVSLADMQNKQGGRIYITSSLTKDIHICIEASDVELGVPIIFGGEGYSLTEADLSHIHLTLPVGYEWKYDSVQGGIVISQATGVISINAGQPDVVDSYDATGRKVKGQQTKGLTIQRMSDGTVKKAIIKK